MSDDNNKLASCGGFEGPGAGTPVMVVTEVVVKVSGDGNPLRRPAYR